MKCFRLLLALGALAFAFASDEEEALPDQGGGDMDEDRQMEMQCEAEIEPKVRALMKQKKTESVGALLKAHDHDKDGHVSEKELSDFFHEAGLSDNCKALATKAHKHLVDSFDEDQNEKLSHEEIDSLMRDAASHADEI
eukprot:TRINITY_DN73458_c0_g1_i1.p1 TRINITY_DN73458_c0_g1~~TRINITY_DN73458_c0_g1_i1.p1  ORF type:complete len:162 (+),score=48.79 TRINITY_DN73458_c0_g1_i1:72-488(+)